MFERLKRKTKVQVVEPDVRPVHIIPNKYRKKFIEMGYASKTEISNFLKVLTRTELMDFEDSKQFDGTKAEDAAWEAVSDEEWTRTWPMGKHTYQERIPDIVTDVISKYKLSDLLKQVELIQKKLDRLSKLVENTEVTMSGRTAINL